MCRDADVGARWHAAARLCDNCDHEHLLHGEPIVPSRSATAWSDGCRSASWSVRCGRPIRRRFSFCPAFCGGSSSKTAGSPASAFKVPHRKSYVIGREPLLEIVDRAELGLADDAPLPERVLLLARPDPRELAVHAGRRRCWSAAGGCCFMRGSTPRWRIARLRGGLVAGADSPTDSADWAGRVRGDPHWCSARRICCCRRASDASIYAEFVAVYLGAAVLCRQLSAALLSGFENTCHCWTN